MHAAERAGPGARGRDRKGGAVGNASGAPGKRQEQGKPDKGRVFLKSTGPQIRDKAGLAPRIWDLARLSPGLYG